MPDASSHLAKCFGPLPNAFVPDTFGFRPTPEEKQLVAAARKVTGRKTSDLLRLCLARALTDIVQELEQARVEAKREFDQLAVRVGLNEKPASYRSKEPPPKRKAG